MCLPLSEAHSKVAVGRCEPAAMRQKVARLRLHARRLGRDRLQRERGAGDQAAVRGVMRGQRARGVGRAGPFGHGWMNMVASVVLGRCLRTVAMLSAQNTPVYSNTEMSLKEAIFRGETGRC